MKVRGMGGGRMEGEGGRQERGGGGGGREGEERGVGRRGGD